MAEQRESERHLAMLIDGDNAQYSLLKEMLEEVSRYGIASYRRAYGDWTTPDLSSWRSVMLANAIQPVQQWRYTTGKNATDSTLIIDAMDILYSETVQGFCIVSSDSDYTRLCTRIRESGKFVMGIGRQQTPEAFVNACDVFVYVENLSQPPKTAQPNKASSSGAGLVNLLQRAFDILEPDGGWVHLGALGKALRQLDPSFDSRTYGHKSLSLLIKSLPKKLDIKATEETGPSTIYVRMKDG